MATDREIAEQIGRNIQKARESEGLSCLEVASRAGVSLLYWQDIECGDEIPSIVQLLRMAEALDYDHIGLLEGIDDG